MIILPEEAGTLWAVNIHGPDDIIAAPDYLSAVRMANAFNAWWLDLKTKQPHNDAIDARMWAIPTDWPGNDAQGHADELSKPHPEYQWLRDASAAPHLAAVRVKKLEDWQLDQILTGVKSQVNHNGWEEPYVRNRLRHELERILSALEPSAARELSLEEAARNAAMYLATGFISCPRCGEEVETKNTDAEYTLRAALSSPAHADAGKVEGDGPTACVGEMQTSSGADYYVCVKVGDREITPHMFKERWKAEYEVAEWLWLFNGGDKPDLLAYGPLPSAPSEGSDA